MSLSLEVFPTDLQNSILSWIGEQELFSAAQPNKTWNSIVTKFYKEKCQNEIVQFKKILKESIEGAHLPTRESADALINGLSVFSLDIDLPNNQFQKEMQNIRLLFNKIFVPVEARLYKSIGWKITELELLKIKKQLAVDDKDPYSELEVKNHTKFICPEMDLKDTHFLDQGSYTLSKLLPKYFPMDWFASQPSKIAFLLRGKLILFTCTYMQDGPSDSKTTSPFEFYIRERDESDLMESNTERKLNRQNAEYKIFLLADKKSAQTFHFLSSAIISRLSKDKNDPLNQEILPSLYKKNHSKFPNSQIFIEDNREFIKQILFKLGEKETAFMAFFNEEERKENFTCKFSRKIKEHVDKFPERNQSFAQLCAEIYFLSSDHFNSFEKKIRSLHSSFSKLETFLLHIKLNTYRSRDIFENIFQKLAKVEKISIMDLYYLFEAGDFYINLSKRRSRSPSSVELSEVYRYFFTNPALLKGYDKIEETIKDFFKMNPVSESP